MIPPTNGFIFSSIAAVIPCTTPEALTRLAAAPRAPALPPAVAHALAGTLWTLCASELRLDLTAFDEFINLSKLSCRLSNPSLSPTSLNVLPKLFCKTSLQDGH